MASRDPSKSCTKFSISITAASAMPRWQKRVLIGKVTPTATEEALVFAPGTGFACKLIDETKPLAEQSTDAPCPEPA